MLPLFNVVLGQEPPVEVHVLRAHAAVLDRRVEAKGESAFRNEPELGRVPGRARGVGPGALAEGCLSAARIGEGREPPRPLGLGGARGVQHLFQAELGERGRC